MHRNLAGKLEGKRPVGRLRHRWEDNIKMDLREGDCDARNEIDFSEERDQCQYYASSVMILQSPEKPLGWL